MIVLIHSYSINFLNLFATAFLREEPKFISGVLMSKERLRPSQFGRTKSTWAEEGFQLNQEQKAEISALYTDELESFKQGGLLKGKIVTVSPDGVVIDINYKSDGVIPIYEFNKVELEQLKPGTELEVILDELESIEGNVVLSYEKAKALKAWEAIMKKHEADEPVEGVVLHKVKGGLSVDIGIPAFLPGSQVDVQRVTNFDQFVGQTITAHIIKVNKKRGNVIISRRKFLNEQRAESRKKILDAIKEGSVIQGVVKNITNYGAFVDIGGVDGLLHITDMTWGRISHPSEILKIGETIAVKVISFDKDHEKISLGIKQLSGNPWEKLNPDIKAGSIIKGKISSITEYGLFIEVADGVEGLVHISEISWTNRITDLHKHYRVGQEIEAIVVSLDKENRRMSLSIKQLEKNPWDIVDEKFKVGETIKGKISNITDFGIFVSLLPGVDGLVHVSDISWTDHVEHPQDVFSKDDEVEAVITGINKDEKKISLSIKHLQPNPWESIEKDFPAGTIVDGEITKITNFGAFVKIPPSGIEGLVHSSEITGDIKVGEKVKAKVLKTNQEEQKLALTLNLDAPLQTEQRAKKPERVKETREPQQAKQKSLFQLELEKHIKGQED